MKRVIIYTISLCFYLTSCTKQSVCKDSSNYREGTLIVYKKTDYANICGETCWGKFFYDSSLYSDGSGVGIFGSIPSKYKKMDTVRVGVDLYRPPMSCVTLYASPCKIKCIEQIN